MNAKVKGTAFALFGGACWGLSSVVGKLLFDMRGMNAEWLVTARLVFGGFIMLCFAAFQKKGEIFKIWKEKKTAFSMILFAALGMLACQLTYFLCVQYSNPATATVLQYTSPVMIMLLCLFLDRKLPRIIDIIVLIAVVVGVFLMSTHGNIHSLAISAKSFNFRNYNSYYRCILYGLASTSVKGVWLNACYWLGNVYRRNYADAIFKILGTSGKMGLDYRNLSGNCSCIRNDCFF